MNLHCVLILRYRACILEFVSSRVKLLFFGLIHMIYSFKNLDYFIKESCFLFEFADRILLNSTCNILQMIDCIIYSIVNNLKSNNVSYGHDLSKKGNWIIRIRKSCKFYLQSKYQDFFCIKYILDNVNSGHKF